jgi:transposase-like protein
MSAAELDNPAFQDDDLAREWLEACIWPDGPKCPHCGSFGEGVTRMHGSGGAKGTKHRPGCFQCNACRSQFTVTVGTVMVPEVNSATLKPILREQIDKAAMVFTDEATYYAGLRADFPAGHFTVQHNIGEYVRGGATVNRCENYFSILKRGINGVYQHVSPTHLKRYVGEFDFRYNNRLALGVNDAQRAEKVAKGAAGKRLTYQRTRQQPEAEAS